MSRRLPRRRSGRSRDRGTVAVEMVIVVPAVMLFLGLAIASGRIWLARGVVEDSAYSAARAASLARSVGQARVDGDTAGRSALDTGGLSCQPGRVTVDPGGFAVPVGQSASVRATVSCRVLLSDVAVPGLPGALTVTATSVSALDRYRER